MGSVHLAFDSGARLGECPLWIPDEQRLYWVDIEDHTVHRFDPATGDDEERTVPGRPGSIVRTSVPGRFLMALETDVVWFDWETGTVTPWLQLERQGTGNRLNDGRTDPRGRYWVGSMYEVASEGRFTGKLHRIDGDGSFKTSREQIGVSNGLAFDPDRGRMYFADTLRETVWRYDYDAETGRAAGEIPFIDFSSLPGRPDGACVDTEGCYWVAAVYGWAVHRFTPDGRLDRTVELPVEAPTMPAFGGADLDMLFVTSIGTGGSSGDAADQQGAGGLFVVDTGVTGRVDQPFPATGD